MEIEMVEFSVSGMCCCRRDYRFGMLLESNLKCSGFCSKWCFHWIRANSKKK